MSLLYFLSTILLVLTIAQPPPEPSPAELNPEPSSITPEPQPTPLEPAPEPVIPPVIPPTSEPEPLPISLQPEPQPTVPSEPEPSPLSNEPLPAPPVVLTPEPQPSSPPTPVPVPLPTPTTPPTAPTTPPTAPPVVPSGGIPEYVFLQINGSGGVQPTSRASALIGISSLDNTTFVILGGTNGTNDAGLKNYVFDSKVSSWQELPIIFSRTGYPCSAQRANGPMYIYGGTSDGIKKNELSVYSFDLGNTTSLPEASNLAPTNGAGCTVVSNNQFVIFGGFYNGDMTNCSNKLFFFNLTSNTWIDFSDFPQPPEPRYGASVVASDNAIVVYGGACGSQIYSDVWQFNLGTRTWAKDDAKGTPGLKFHSATLASNGTLYVFGGASSVSDATNNLYSYNFNYKNWSSIAPSSLPPARQRAALAANGNRLFLFGGVSSGTYLSDLWQLVLEKDCLSLKCDECINTWGCGWCKSDTQTCVSGNETNVFVPQSCPKQESFVRKLTQCPEEGFPSWAIALIVIGGVVLIGILVFVIMKIRTKSDYSAI